MPIPPSSSHREVIAGLLADPQPVNWIFTGDSITHGAFHSLGHRDYAEHFAERIRWEMRRVYDLVITTGVNGWKIDDLAERFEWAVIQRAPQVVSINLGINDCSLGLENLGNFEKRYREVLERLQVETSAALILHTPNAIDAGPQWKRDSLPQYVEVVRRLAEDYQTVLVDHAKLWEEARQKETLAYWLSDALHPNEYGHRMMAHTLFKELQIFDPGSAVCRLLVP